MPSPALDERPEMDIYTSSMVNAFRYIQKGMGEQGTIPVSEIYSYYQMFEDEIVETKRDFIYLIDQMNQPVLALMKENAEKATKGR